MNKNKAFFKGALAIFIALASVCSMFTLMNFAVTAAGNTTEFAGGNGTAEDPYLISTKEHLDNVRFYVSAHFKMISDIEFTDADFSKGGAYYNGGSGWEPIGYSPDSFTGVFDGNGHRISNLYINRNASGVGLFGIAESSSVVSNICLLDAEIAANEKVGGIVGWANGATVENCYSLAEVSGTISVGGVIGQINGATVRNCASLSDVYGNSAVGGLVGGVYGNSSVLYCSTTGSVTGGDCVGGIVGYSNPYIYSSAVPAVTIQYCCNDAEITGENRVGGILGYVFTTYAHRSEYVQGTYGGASYSKVVWYSPKEALIKDCYNSGDITATAGTAGGIAGASGKDSGPYSNSSKNVHKSTVSNSYNCGNVEATSYTYAVSDNGNGITASNSFYLESCVETASGAGTKLTHNQMRSQSIFSGWNFDTVWTMKGSDGYLYPELQGVDLLYPEDLKHKHEYTSEVTTPATHLSEGVITYSCSCGDSYAEKLAKLEGHSYCKTEEKDSTCTSEGYVLYSCECGDTYTEKKEKLSHTFTEKIIDNAHLVSAATKESPAVYRYDCSACDTISEDLTFTYGEKIGPLGKTDSITATQNTSSIKLTWNEVETATVYRVYIKNNGSWVKLADINTNTYTISKLSAGTKYSFAVKAGRLYDGKIEWASGYTTTDTATKTVMTSVTAAQNTSAIKLSWKACPGATGYRIYYMSGGAWKVSVSSTTATSYTYNNLRAGAKYTFAIRPYIKNGSNVIWTNYTEFMTATKPTNVTAKASSPSAGKITLTWNAVNGADGYQVYYKSNNGAYKLYNIYSTVQKLTFSNLNPNTTFTFAVRAGIRTSGGNIYGGYVTSSIKPKSNALTNAKATQLWQEAYDVYYNWASWGLYDNYIDTSSPVYFDGAGSLPYYPIVGHSFDSKADLRAYLYNYFDGVITEKILSWIYEYKGVMYTRMPTGRGIEPEMQSIVVKKQASTYAEVYITFVRSSGEQETFIQKMSFVNGKWIFAERFYDQPKYY